MNIPDEAGRRYPEDFKTIGGSAMERRAFTAGAEWARKEALREAAEGIRDYWDACGELIDSNNGARLAFEAIAEQIAEGVPDGQ